MATATPEDDEDDGDVVDAYPAGDARVTKPFCCGMRGRFVTSIIKEDARNPMPTDFPDYVANWRNASGSIVILAKHCSFCGAETAGQPTRVVQSLGKIEDTGAYGSYGDQARQTAKQAAVKTPSTVEELDQFRKDAAQLIRDGFLTQTMAVLQSAKTNPDLYESGYLAILEAVLAFEAQREVE